MDVYLPGPSRRVVPPPNAVVADAEENRSGIVRPEIAGGTFAILDNGWDVMEELTAAMTAELYDRGAAEVIRYPVFVGGPVEPEFLDEIAAKVAGAICGLGN